MVDGRPVHTDDEIVLGRAALGALDARVGGWLRASRSTAAPRAPRGRPRRCSRRTRPMTLPLVPWSRWPPWPGSRQRWVSPTSSHGRSRRRRGRAAGRPRGADREHDRHGGAHQWSATSSGWTGAYLLAGYLALLGLAAARPRPGAGASRERRGELATLRARVRTPAGSHDGGRALAHGGRRGGGRGLPIGLAVGRLSWPRVGGAPTMSDLPPIPRNPLRSIVVAVLIRCGCWRSCSDSDRIGPPRQRPPESPPSRVTALPIPATLRRSRRSDRRRSAAQPECSAFGRRSSFAQVSCWIRRTGDHG